MNTPSWCNEPRLKPPSKLDVGFVPRLSLKERDRRWNTLRKKMLAHGLDTLVLYGNDSGYGRGMVNFRYITHIADIHGGWGIFPVEGECTVWVAPVHMALPWSKYLALQDWITDFRPNSGVAGVVTELRSRGLDKARIGIVSFGSTGVSADTLPYKGYTQLMEALPNASFIDANPLLTEMRIIKSKEELDFLYKAGEIARKKIDVMCDSMKIGNTEADIFANMVASDIRNGAEPLNFLLLNTGNLFEDDPGYKHLIHGSSQPASPTMRKLRKGDMATCEFHTSYGGYLAGAEFTCFLGEPPKELSEIHAACMESIQFAMETIKPGVTMRDGWRAIRSPVEERGFDYCELGFHGHGLASPEFPLSVYRESDGGVMAGAHIADMPFEEDMVLCLNLDVHNPKWRKDVGVMLGDMIHITKDGAKKMIGIPTDLKYTEA